MTVNLTPAEIATLAAKHCDELAAMLRANANAFGGSSQHGQDATRDLLTKWERIGALLAVL
jgi:hypothetical protein